MLARILGAQMRRGRSNPDPQDFNDVRLVDPDPIYFHERKFQHFVEDFCLLVLDKSAPGLIQRARAMASHSNQTSATSNEIFRSGSIYKALSEAWARTAEGAGND